MMCFTGTMAGLGRGSDNRYPGGIGWPANIYDQLLDREQVAA